GSCSNRRARLRSGTAHQTATIGPRALLPGEREVLFQRDREALSQNREATVLTEGFPIFFSPSSAEQKIRIYWHQFSHYVRYLALLLLIFIWSAFPRRGSGGFSIFRNSRPGFGFRSADPCQGLSQRALVIV